MSAATLQRSYVFLSYSRSEGVVAKRLEQDLRGHGFQVWRDVSNIDPGSSDWEEAIREGISHAYAVVLIASPSVIQSHYIKGELSLAKLNLPNRIYPVWVDGTDWPDCVPIDFINTEYIDMRGEQYEEGLKVLETMLQKAKEQPSPPQPDIEPPPPPAQPPPPLPLSRRFPKRLVLIVGLVLLLIVSGGIIGVIVSSSQSNQPNIQATATTVASHYPFSNSLVLSNQLSSNDNNLWDDFTNTGYGCKFMAGAYHVYENEKGQYYWDCVAKASNLSNFTFEVQMTIIKGDCGGMVFRGDNAHSNYYLFEVCQDGTYNLYTYRDDHSTTLKSNSSSSIKQGLDQSNLIAVVARGQSLTLYVNNKPIDQVGDKTYSSGQIGFVAEEESGNPTYVAYNNARAWSL